MGSRPCSGTGPGPAPLGSPLRASWGPAPGTWSRGPVAAAAAGAGPWAVWSDRGQRTGIALMRSSSGRFLVNTVSTPRQVGQLLSVSAHRVRQALQKVCPSVQHTGPSSTSVQMEQRDSFAGGDRNSSTEIPIQGCRLGGAPKKQDTEKVLHKERGGGGARRWATLRSRTSRQAKKKQLVSYRGVHQGPN